MNQEMLDQLTQEVLPSFDAKMPDLSEEDSRVWAEATVAILDMKKASQIKMLEVADQTIVAEYFVICTGSSNTNVRGLAGEVMHRMGMCGVELLRSEGFAEGEWVILDFGSVLVHIFRRDIRDFFHLEKLWSDAKVTDISALLK